MPCTIMLHTLTIFSWYLVNYFVYAYPKVHCLSCCLRICPTILSDWTHNICRWRAAGTRWRSTLTARC